MRRKKLYALAEAAGLIVKRELSCGEEIVTIIRKGRGATAVRIWPNGDAHFADTDLAQRLS